MPLCCLMDRFLHSWRHMQIVQRPLQSPLQDTTKNNDEVYEVVLRRGRSRRWLYIDTLQLSQCWWSPSCTESVMGQIKAESGSVGWKVLPICDAVAAGSNGRESTDGCEVKEGPRIQRRRAVPRVKELLRWAAKAKAQSIGSKGWKVLHFRSRQDLKDPVDDMSSKSSKISFRWEVGSCSSTSSVYSALSLNSSARTDQICTKNFSKLSTSLPTSEYDVNALNSLKTEQHVKKAQWITTDSDFVVLEL